MNTGQKVRFGVFGLDRASGELLKGGTKVRLQEQPFQVLSALVERPGEVVSREQFRRLLWPDDTFVDFEDDLSTAVKKVCQALGGSATNPRFFETLPKRGCRFIAPVDGAPEPRDEKGAAEALQTFLGLDSARGSGSYFADLGRTDNNLNATRGALGAGPPAGSADQLAGPRAAAGFFARRFPSGVCLGCGRR